MPIKSKWILLLLFGLFGHLFTCFLQNAYGQVCNTSGNLVVFSNYDGGVLNINVDADIADLRIGICTYEPVQVNISGAFAGNITQVLYAGFNSVQNNNNCGIGNFPTSISGVPAANYDILTIPPATITNPNGYNFGIICAYSCNTGSEQGGCNTIDQVLDFFNVNLGGSLYTLHVQYCCWLNSDVYSVAALAGSCCQNTAATATIAYEGLPYCTGITTPQLPVMTGSAVGSFSAFPAGLNINAITGAVTPAGSVPGIYTVIYSVPGCPGFTTNASVEITTGTPATIDYGTNVFCAQDNSGLPTITGNAGGVFEASPAGLDIDPVTGIVNLTNSQPGVYVVAYTLPLPCPATATTNMTVLALPVSGFSYSANVYCVGSGIAPVILEPSAQLGTFAALPNGLVFMNSQPGTLDLASSAPGDYLVTHTVTLDGCLPSVSQVQVTIQDTAWALITYPLAQYCNAQSELVDAVITGTLGGVFSAQPSGLVINTLTGSINPAAGLPGNYEVSYTLAAAGACPAFVATTTVSILPPPQIQITASAQNITAGENVTLTAAGADSFTWDNAQTGSEITVAPTVTTTYCVTGFSGSDDCTATDCLTVSVNTTDPTTVCVPPILPNAFSPNNDGVNDKLGVITTGCLLQSFELAIFNRWGQRIFYTANTTDRWDGTFNGITCELGTYVYTLAYQVEGQQPEITSGSVILLW